MLLSVFKCFELGGREPCSSSRWPSLARRQHECSGGFGVIRKLLQECSFLCGATTNDSGRLLSRGCQRSGCFFNGARRLLSGLGRFQEFNRSFARILCFGNLIQSFKRIHCLGSHITCHCILKANLKYASRNRSPSPPYLGLLDWTSPPIASAGRIS